MSGYENLIQPNETTDFGLALQRLIEANINNLNTCYLARISAINGNKVSIVPAMKKSQTDKTVVINNCMVAFPWSGFWHTQHKLKTGDIGVAITLQDDISSYKASGKEGLNQTKRTKDINDSIFFPLSLFDTLPNDDINFIIKSTDEKCKLEFDNANNGTFQAQLLALKSENTTLKTALSSLSDILSSALILQSPSGTQPFDPATVSAFNSWKSDLDNLFLE